jgi:hypothetical protein
MQLPTILKSVLPVVAIFVGTCAGAQEAEVTAGTLAPAQMRTFKHIYLLAGESAVAFACDGKSTIMVEIFDEDRTAPDGTMKRLGTRLFSNEETGPDIVIPEDDLWCTIRVLNLGQVSSSFALAVGH